VGALDVAFAGPDGLELTGRVFYPAVANGEALAENEWFTHLEALEEPQAVGGPWPLVFWSHGSSGVREAGAEFQESWVRQGYVVFAVDHIGNAWFDEPTTGELLDIGVRRPKDIYAAWQAIDAWTNEGGHPLRRRVDTAAPVLAGHSAGGHTVYLSMGAEIETSMLVLQCAAFDITDSTVCDEARDSSQTTFSFRPDGMPVPSAALMFAPFGAELYTPGSFAAMDVPSLIIIGENDETSPLDPTGQFLYDNLGGPAGLVMLEGTGHSGMVGACTNEEVQNPLPEANQVECDASTADGDVVVDVVDAVTSAWLRWHVAGDSEGETNLLTAADVHAMTLEVRGQR
jgi:predicted dienelactone hydrolase